MNRSPGTSIDQARNGRGASTVMGRCGKPFQEAQNCGLSFCTFQGFGTGPPETTECLDSNHRLTLSISFTLLIKDHLLANHYLVIFYLTRWHIIG